MTEHDLFDFLVTYKDEQEARMKKDIEAAEILFKRGKLLLEEKKLLDALDCFEKVIELNPFNHEAYKLHEELKLRLGPSRDEDCTIFVRDPHKQLGTLILRAGECHSWFRREVPGVYDMAMYLSTERGAINYGYHRVAAIVICVFTHQYEKAKIQLEEMTQIIRANWGMGAIVNPVGGNDLSPYFEVLLRPEYEKQEIDRLAKDEGTPSIVLVDCEDEQDGEE